MKSVKKVLCTLFISCFILFPTSAQLSANTVNIEEGTGSVLVVYEQEGKENTIPLGEGTKAPQTGDISNINFYLTIAFLSFLLILFLYKKEKKKELC